MGDTGMFYVGSREPVEETEMNDMQERATNSRSLSKLTKTILRLSIMMGLEPTVAGGQEETCNDPGPTNSGENFWIGLCLFLMVFSWVALAVTAIWFWKRLNKRLIDNELQQAETDSFMGAQRDALNDMRREMREHSNNFSRHLENYTTEVNMLEEYLDGLHFGLVEQGGFVRHNQLSGDQRSQMLTQERANLVLHNMRQRAPDTTDATMQDVARPSSSSARPSDVLATPDDPAAGTSNADLMYVGAAEEDAEEEAPTSDPENNDGGENEPLDRLLRNLRQMQNEALSTERFADASDLQNPIMAVLESTSNGAGLSMEVVTATRNSMQRPYRSNRNRGEAWRADVHKAYADNFQLLLQ